MSNDVTQSTVVSQSAIDPDQSVELLALFNPDGTPFTGDAVTPAAHVAAVTTVNATDLPSAEALANANKTTINALIASLQTAGFLAAS